MKLLLALATGLLAGCSEADPARAPAAADAAQAPPPAEAPASPGATPGATAGSRPGSRDGSSPGSNEGPSDASSAPDLPGDPGPLRAVAGLPGFHLRARRTFDEAPELPYRFEARYLFPGRVHWQTWDESSPELRRLDYRYGDALHYVPAGTSVSEVYEGEARREMARNMDLLSAVVMWPDGFDWEGGEEARTAPLTPLDGEPTGALRAELDGSDRPVRIVALGEDGTELEALHVTAWREAEGRSWPAELEFRYQGLRIWTETLEPIETRVFAAEHFFVPPDRR